MTISFISPMTALRAVGVESAFTHFFFLHPRYVGVLFASLPLWVFDPVPLQAGRSSRNRRSESTVLT